MAARAVVMLSGGMDSATALAIAKADGFDVIALTFDYGQRHRKEIEAARRVAKHVGVREHRIVKVDLGRIGASALTDRQIAVPERRSLEEIGRGIPPTYVPARNTIFLSHALAVAEATRAKAIYIAANAIDYSVDGHAKVWVQTEDWTRLMPIKEFCSLPKGEYRTVAVDPRTLKLEWRRVTGRFRHKSNEKRCFTIQIERGQEIAVTEDHSLFTIDPVTAQIVPVKGSRITKGMPIVVPNDLADVADSWKTRIYNSGGKYDRGLRAQRSAFAPVSSLRRLATSKLAFLPVTDIKETSSPWMYDLSVEGAENFVANGILAHNSGYPDCRPEYFEAFREVARLGTKRGVEGDVIEIRTPLIHMRKADIVRKGAELGVPFELTWSCYHGRVKACGLCDACELRLKGFQEAGLQDPLPYENVS